MTKPVLSTLSELTPIFIQEYERYLPTAFDGSLTMLEKINMVIATLGDIYTVSNDLIAKWNEVMTWILGEGLNESVTTQLDQYITDGTFDTLINNTLLLGKPDIFVQSTAPTQKSLNTYWFQDDGNKNVQVSKWNGTQWDLINPKTKSINVSMNNGNTVEKTVGESAYIHGIKTEMLYDETSKTTYYLTTIPYLDSKGNVNKIKRGFAKDSTNTGQVESARSFANRKNASLVVNASIFDITTLKLQGMQITNGVAIETVPTRADRYILGITDDGTLTYYEPTTSATTILNAGVKEALTSFLPLITNGVRISQSVLDTYLAKDWNYRRQVISQMPNKDYIILSTESDTLGNVGFTCDDCIRVLLAKGVSFAFMLDGGGSMQTVVRGRNLLTPKDDSGKTERPVPDFLYFSKTILTDRDEDLKDTNSDVGEVKKKVNDLEYDLFYKTAMNNGYISLKGASDYTSHGIEIWKGDVKTHKLVINENDFGFFDYVQGKYLFQVGSNGQIITTQGGLGNVTQYTIVANDLNFIGGSGWVWCTPATINTPDPAFSWSVQSIRLDSQNGLQLARCFSSPYATKTRRISGGVWSAWV